MIEPITNVDIVYSLNVDKPRLILPIELNLLSDEADSYDGSIADGVGGSFDGSA